MIPENKDPILEDLNEERVKQWRKAFDENKEQRNKDFLRGWQATLCKCKTGELKCKNTNTTNL